jgi:hypothetical protein
MNERFPGYPHVSKQNKITPPRKPKDTTHA